MPVVSSYIINRYKKQERILVWCAPPTCQPSLFWLPDVSTGGSSKQVSSDGHQMSLTEAATGGSYACIHGEGAGLKLVALYSEVQCIIGNGHMRTPPPLPWTARQTDTTENITFPQLRWREVKIRIDYNRTKQEVLKNC